MAWKTVNPTDLSVFYDHDHSIYGTTSMTSKTEWGIDELNQWLSYGSPKGMVVRRIDVSNCGLTKIPSTISRLKTLKELVMDGNMIKRIPEKLFELTGLVYLSLYNNNIEVIPSGIGNLTRLQTLQLSANNISVIPPEIADMQYLQSLFLDHNRITELPAELSQCASLNCLSVKGNCIDTLRCKSLMTLSQLDLSDNAITEFPTDLNVVCAFRLVLTGNPLETLSENIFISSECTVFLDSCMREALSDVNFHFSIVYVDEVDTKPARCI